MSFMNDSTVVTVTCYSSMLLVLSSSFVHLLLLYAVIQSNYEIPTHWIR